MILNSNYYRAIGLFLGGGKVGVDQEPMKFDRFISPSVNSPQIRLFNV